MKNNVKIVEFNGTDDILINHFSRFIDDDIKMGLYPYFIGYEKCVPEKPPTYNLKEDGHRLHFVLKGSGYVEKNKKKYKITENTIFYLSPNANEDGQSACYYPDKDDPWEYIWFNIYGRDVEKLVSCAKLSDKNFFYTMKNPSGLKHKLIDMINTAQNPVKRSLSYYLPNIISFFCEVAAERNSFNFVQSKRQEKVKLILDKIETDHLNVDFSLKKIADEMFYSLSYISRIFKEETGQSPIEYVTSLRMLHAKELLNSFKNEKSIAQISYECGYSSPYYFSKEFKKYYGCPPSKFKNQR
ncbi:MAG: helix-turn-helix domain-containing protein [Clostridia bacterium]|nr:helix-turn-helix domain-containing protein [Clostridia bacterium]